MRTAAVTRSKSATRYAIACSATRASAIPLAIGVALASFALLANPIHADEIPAAATPAVTPSTAQATPVAQTQADGPIRVAVALPLTGQRRAIGAAARQRLALVRSAIDANGGIARRALQLDIFDDGCARESAQELAKRIVALQPPVATVIGHPCATAAVAAAPLYQQAGVLFLAAGTRHAELTDKRAGPLVFRAAGRDDHQGVDAGRRLRVLAGDNGTALVIHDRTVLARTLADAARMSAAEGGHPHPAELTIVAGENDYTRIIDEVAIRKPDAILFVGFPSEAAIILRQLRTRDLSMPFLVNDAMATREFIDHADALLETHVEVMMPVSISRDATLENEASDALVASDVAAAFAVWVDAVTATARTNAHDIAERLSSPRGHLEEIAFDAKGDAKVSSFAPFRRRDGSWQRADPANANESPRQQQTATPHSNQR